MSRTRNPRPREIVFVLCRLDDDGATIITVFESLDKLKARAERYSRVADGDDAVLRWGKTRTADGCLSTIKIRRGLAGSPSPASSADELTDVDAA
jgi:hypothetical protein